MVARVLRLVRFAMLPTTLALIAGWLVLFELNGIDETELLNGTQTLGFIAFLIVGSLIISHQPHNVVGWICLVVGFGFIYMSFAEQYAIYAYITNPGGLPLREFFAWTTMFAWTLPVMLPLTLLLQLFPDGKPRSSRWRVVAWLTLGLPLTIMVNSALLNDEIDSLDGLLNPFRVTALSPVLDVLATILEPALGLTFVVSAISAVSRFRAARGVERLQMKGFAYAVGACAVLLLANDILTSGDGNLWYGIAVILLATSIGVSVLRYRLYDIDRLINRTLVYGALTAGLAATYFALVVGLQEVLRPLSGGSDLAIVVTTLVVAALFLPARHRIQDAVDRRFNRRAYDAALTVDAFSTRLREQIELDALRYELLAVIEETMAPVQASLWLRRAGGQS